MWTTCPFFWLQVQLFGGFQWPVPSGGGHEEDNLILWPCHTKIHPKIWRWPQGHQGQPCRRSSWPRGLWRRWDSYRWRGSHGDWNFKIIRKVHIIKELVADHLCENYHSGFKVNSCMLKRVTCLAPIPCLMGWGMPPSRLDFLHLFTCILRNTITSASNLNMSTDIRWNSQHTRAYPKRKKSSMWHPALYMYAGKLERNFGIVRHLRSRRILHKWHRSNMNSR